MPSEPDPTSPRLSSGRRIGVALAVAAAAGLPALWILNRLTRPPANLGLENSRLRACPDSPNCVVSENHDDAHRIDPLRFVGSLEETQARLRQVLDRRPGARLVEAGPNYLRYEFRTAVCRFVDDVEFRFDPEARVVHVRSASRVGYSDLGTNRRRIEALRQALQG